MSFIFLNKIPLPPKNCTTDLFREKISDIDLPESSDVEFHQYFSEKFTKFADEDLDTPILEFFTILYVIFSNYAVTAG